MKHTLFLICFSLWMTPNSLAQKTSVVPRKANPSVAKCQLTEAPRVRGFFLGQTVDQINKIIPNFREAYKFKKADLSDRQSKISERTEVNDAYYTVSMSDWMKSVDLRVANELNYVAVSSNYPFGFPSEKELSMPGDIAEVRIDWYFLEERLYAFVVYYPEHEPKNIGSFVKQATESLGLPASKWTDSKIGDGIGRWVHCRNFKVEVRIVVQGSPLVAISDTDVEAEILRLEKEILARIKKEARDQVIREKREREIFKP